MVLKPGVRARKAEQMRRYVRDPRLRARHKARWLAQRAVEAGRLVKQPCENCGGLKVDAHHEDYSKPLAVRWLCRPCHRAEHRAAHAARTQGGQANLPAVLAGLVLAVAALWLTGWVGDHAAVGTHTLACITRAIGG